MAEGGKESLHNNLCANQNEKTMEEKNINQMSAFPDLPISSSNSLQPGFVNGLSHNHVADAAAHQYSRQPGFVNGLSHKHVADAAAHQYSWQSTTELKQHLDDAPSLTPCNSHLQLNDALDSGTQSDMPRSSEELPSHPDNLPNGDRTRGLQQGNAAQNKENSVTTSNSEQDSEATSREILSSYVHAEFSPASSSTQGAVSMFPTHQPGKGPEKASTNDLSANKAMPQPLYFPGMFARGGLMPNMMCYPVGYVQAGHHPMPFAMFGGPGGHHFMHTNGMMSAPVAPQMMQNISCPPHNGQGASPLTTMFCNGTDHPTLDSRNFTPASQGPSQHSSEENNSGGSRSFSINPSSDTRLVRLRKPVLDWLQKKLDNPCRNNWEALADHHGMKYEDIRAHLTECRHTRDSPFLKLLETESFHTYTIKDFLEDMKIIERKES